MFLLYFSPRNVSPVDAITETHGKGSVYKCIKWMLAVLRKSHPKHIDDQLYWQEMLLMLYITLEFD